MIINCVALTNVDQCEKSPEAAERVNAALPGELAYETARRNIKLVQISTDAVFNGKCGGYVEEDPVSPTNVYAATKLAGEKAGMAEDSEALVCRVVFYGWSISGTRSLAEWFFNKLSTGEATRGFSDVIFSPLLATDLAAIILKLVEHDESGLFHVVNPQSISKYDFGQILARQFGFDHSLISPASIMDAGLIATRSPNLNLKPDKLLSTLGEDLPDQKTEMSRFHQQYVDGYPSLLKSFNMK
ncbi:MAG: SDR family oxidoreductase [Anaerolineaceae bacterium]|nr:SDR family oxidoreductase [Anaerolineaceae bacterium]